MAKICLFGDSISKGVVLDALQGRYRMISNSFVQILAKEFGFDVKNYSLVGCTIVKGRSLLERYWEEVGSCDVVVLEFGGNDCDHHWGQIAENPTAYHEAKTPLDRFEEQYRKMIEELRAMGKEVVILNLPPIHSELFFQWFTKGMNQQNVLDWLGGTEESIFRFHSSYNDKLGVLASDYDIPLLDIREDLLNRDDYAQFLCEDGIHPNEKGHRIIAESLKRSLRQLLQGESAKGWRSAFNL